MIFSKDILPKSYHQIFFQISGTPLVLYCVKEFSVVPWVGRIIIVADDINRMKLILKEHPIEKVKVVQVNIKYESLKVN